MSVGDFLTRHNNKDAKLDGFDVHPMNVIDIPLDYIDAKSNSKKAKSNRKCGSDIALPTELLENSLGHKYQKFIKKDAGDNFDMISAHHKYLLLSDHSAYTEPHEDMSGSNVFYALLTGEKIFHVFPRDPAITKAIRTMTPDEIDNFLTTQNHTVVRITAGQAIFLPGNLVHRVYTIVDSVAFGCNFISEPQMENSLLSILSEKARVERREMEKSNLFINFEMIAAIFIFETLQFHRLTISANETRVRIDLQRKIKIFKNVLNRNGILSTALFHSNLQKQWVKPYSPKFDWDVVTKFYKTGSFV